MRPQSDLYGSLREQAATLAAAVKNMSERLGEISKTLSSLRIYEHKNRLLIAMTIVSLIFDICLTVTLVVITNIDSNANVLKCVVRISDGVNEVQKQRTDSLYGLKSNIDREISALAKELSAQINASSAAERHAAQAQYLADIAKINKITILPVNRFKATC